MSHANKAHTAKELRAMLDKAREAIAALPAGRQRDNRMNRLAAEEARLFPAKDKSKP